MNEPVETKEYKNYTINIFYDDCSESPMEWDNLSKFICFHSRYDLGHKHDFTSPDEVLNHVKETSALLYPLYLYDHSGQVGYILVEKEDAIKEFGKKKLTKQVISKVYKCIQGEVNTYDQYLAGDVYGYVIEDSDESCWGFYGQEYCLEEAKSTIDYLIQQKIKKHCKQVKKWITHQVPFIYRTQLQC